MTTRKARMIRCECNETDCDERPNHLEADGTRWCPDHGPAVADLPQPAAASMLVATTGGEDCGECCMPHERAYDCGNDVDAPRNP